MFTLISRPLISNKTCRSSAMQLVNICEYIGVLCTTQDVKNQEQNRRGMHITGDIIAPSQILGIDHIRNPKLNKGLAFTLEERQALGIHGLQPARYKTQKEQVELCKITVSGYEDDLHKYLYVTELHDRNEKLFYSLLSENVELLMPVVYTPTVGLACQKFGLIYRRPRGLFITINDRGHCYDVIKNWPESEVRAIVVTDGERILGLGDLGACGMGIPVGKMSLYTALAGIKPHLCLPITLDVGTNNQALLEDPLYVGLRQKRVVGPDYDDFVDEFMQAVVKRYGQNTLIQFEDFAYHNAFKFLEKYRRLYCTFNDDTQGTASVAVAGLMASSRITGKQIRDYTFLFLGAGSAALGIADLCVQAMHMEGLNVTEARERIWMFDLDGLLAVNRPEGRLEGQKAFYVKDHAPTKSLLEIVKEVKPSVMIGVSAAGGAFTPDILKALASFHERPIVFALSNPTCRAECSAECAYKHTEGRVIYSSGSPFGEYKMGDKIFRPGQGNNAYIFPGVALGVIVTGIHHIGEELFLIAAKTVAEAVSEECLNHGSLYPPLSSIREVSLNIACKISQYAYDHGIASTYPEPTDKRAFIKSHLYNFNYEPSLPKHWSWPKPPEIKLKPLEPVKFL